jgi:hypothetical protein
VEQVVPAEVQGVRDGERRGRAIHLGDRYGTVQRDDRARREHEKMVVQLQDLAPVSRVRGGRVAVHGVDRGLDLVRAGLVAPQAPANEGLALGDERAIPAGPVLASQQYEGAVRPGARRAP